MRGSFFEMHVAASGMFAAKAALNVTSHNIANVSIKGYSRQYAEMRATTPLSTNNSKGMVGTGSEVYGIGQHRNFYLDQKYWSRESTLGEYTVKYSQLTFTETLFNELSDTGLKMQLDEFAYRIQDLITNSADSTYRTSVLQQGDSITTFLQNLYEEFHKQQTDVNTEIEAVVQKINSLGREIVSLNKQITISEYTGQKANDLRDQRALLIDELGTYVNIEVAEQEMNDNYALGKYPSPEERNKSHKVLTISINGQEFIDQYEMRPLECRERKSPALVSPTGVGSAYSTVYYNPEDALGLYDIYFANSDVKFNVYSDKLSGQLKGLFDIRDGNNGNYASAVLTANATFNAPSYAVGAAGTGQDQLTMDFDIKDSRIDIKADGGGIFQIKDAGGVNREYSYTNVALAYKYDATTGECIGVTATFDLSPKNSMRPSLQSIITGGPMDVAVGKTSSYKGIPYYMSKLNELARTFTRAMNEGKDLGGVDLNDVIGHVNGVNGNDDKLQTLFYTYINQAGAQETWTSGNFDIYRLNCSNFRLNKDLIEDPTLFVTAKDYNSVSGVSDNLAAYGYINALSDSKLFREGNIGDYVIGTAGELGIDVRQAKRFEDNYSSVVANVDYQRKSVSSVDNNEEMADMVRFQQQFNACTKMMNTIDQIYNVLINQLGA